MRAWLTILVVIAGIVLVNRLEAPRGVLDQPLRLPDLSAGAFSASGNLEASLGGPWPDGLVTYFNAAPEHRWALQQAVDAWNATSVPVRFEAVPRDEADVIIESRRGQSCGHGKATLGYSTRATVIVFEPRRDPRCNRFSAAHVLAHELGHVLGLKHITATCATMNPRGSERGGGHCPRLKSWQWRCRLLEAVDIAAAAELYGGVARALPGAAHCDLYRPPDPPGSIRLVRTVSTSRYLAIAFRRPMDSSPPRFLMARGESSFSVSYRRGRCDEARGEARYRWTVNPGEEQRVFQPILGGGVHCLRVWASDSLGRPSKATATIRVNVPVGS